MTEQAAEFDRYVREHQQSLVRYAVLLTGSAAHAEDLVQEVLARLYPRWGTLEDPHPYVRRSLTNEYLSWRRRWSTRHLVFTDPAAATFDQADPASDALDAGPHRQPDPELWRLLQELPRQQRAAVVLRFYEGLSDAEIAEALSCREPTVRVHVSRGLAALRRVDDIAKVASHG